jgi:hypothetical protein
MRKYLIPASVLLLCGSALAQPSFVRATAKDRTGATVASITTDATRVDSGDLLFVAVGAQIYCSALGITSVSDTAGNSYTLIATKEDPNQIICLATYYAKNTTANAANQVTVTFSAGRASASMSVQEWAGLSTTAPLSGAAVSGAADASASFSGGSGLPAVNNSVVLAGIIAYDFRTFTAGTGYTVPSGAVASFGQSATEYQIFTASGSSTPSFTTNSPTSGAMVGALFVSPSGSSSGGAAAARHRMLQ